eukprot:m.38197 g.38197  ORF g.38197 m.38197 type:complete len:675 (-) comp11158_c0_seq1:165-2189(-)
MADGGVVWQGSPVHKYLQEAGLDVAAVRRAEPLSENNGEGGVQGNVRRGLGDWVTGHVLRAWRALLSPALDVRELRAQFCREYVQLVLASPLVLNDDADTVIGAEPSFAGATGTACHVDLTRSQEGLCSLLTVGVMKDVSAAGVFMLPMALRGVDAWPSNQLHDAAAVLSFAVGIGWLLQRGRRHLFGWRLCQQHQSNLRALSEMLQAQDVLATRLSRAIRLAQEAELTRRGFAFAHDKLPPITRLERGGRRTCRILRLSVFRAVQANLQLVRRSTTNLMAMVPLCESVDYVNNYLAVSRPADLGLCTATEEKDVLAQTDDLSLASLKHHFTVMNDQCSEYLRRLCLSFSQRCQRQAPILLPDAEGVSLGSELAAAALDESVVEERQGTVKGADADEDFVMKLFWNLKEAQLRTLSSTAARLTDTITQEVSFEVQRQEQLRRNKVTSDTDGPVPPSRPLPPTLRQLEAVSSVIAEAGQMLQASLSTLHLCHLELRDVFDEFQQRDGDDTELTSWLLDRLSTVTGPLSSLEKPLESANVSYAVAIEELHEVTSVLKQRGGVLADVRAAQSADVGDDAAASEIVVESKQPTTAMPASPPNQPSHKPKTVVFEAYTGPEESTLPEEAEERQRWMEQRRRRQAAAEAGRRQREDDAESARQLMSELQAVLQHLDDGSL